MSRGEPRFAADLLSRRIHLVTGKGGVGRTTVASALAIALARAGKRVLLTEIGDPEGGPSPLARHFEAGEWSPDPQPLGPEGLNGCHVWATRGQELFARSVIPAGPLIRTALRSKTLRKFVSAVPSLYEMGIFFHLLTLLEAERAGGEPEHEVIVADMPATGQTLALTSLPEILLDALPDGPIPEAMRRGQSYLNDPAHCLAWVVTLPEELPVSEALELVEGLRATDVHSAGIVLNKIPHDPFEPAERRALDKVLAQHAVYGEHSLRRLDAVREARERLLASTVLPVLDVPEVVDEGKEADDDRDEPSDGVAEDRRALLEAVGTGFSILFGAERR